MVMEILSHVVLMWVSVVSEPKHVKTVLGETVYEEMLQNQKYVTT